MNMTRESIATEATDLGVSVWKAHNMHDRSLLAIGSIVCWVIFSFIGRMMSLPMYPGHAASVLRHASPAGEILMLIIGLVACSMIASLLTARVHAEAGLFCAAVGLMAISVHGGPMRSVLMEAHGPGIFRVLALELALLYVGVTVAWMALAALMSGGVIRERDSDVAENEEENVSQGALAMLIHIVVMTFTMLVLAQSDDKKQVIAAVSIASWLGAIAAHSVLPTRPSAWFLAAPLIVGVAGYLIAASTSGYTAIGQVSGAMPALARPLPLDYAGAGVAGALLGYWMSRRWQHERHHPPETEEEVEEALEHPQS
jgi:hypothetical protein